MPELIRIDPVARRARPLAENFQNVRVQPRRLALAERVVEVESASQSLAVGQPLYVTDRHGVLEEHPP